MFDRRVTRRTLLPGLLALLLVVSAAQAKINLELRPLPEPCVSRELWIELYAVSDSEANQSIAAMDVILTWDPAVLRLLGNDDTGQYPYNWLFSGFPNDSGLDGLNNTWTDGNALYTAMAQLGGGPAWATPEGLLVASFIFRKLHVGEPTDIQMPRQYGQYTKTVVYDGYIPNYDVTGELIGAEGLVPGPRGDMNCDGVIDGFDIQPFVLALTNPGQYQATYPDCDIYHADTNCDGVIDGFDIQPLVGLLAG